MIKIEYPLYQPKIKTVENAEFIFDEYRKKWVALNPEEWVRQNFLQYLVKTKEYPGSLIAIEKEIKLGELKKRFDIVVYDKETRPWMIVECKAMNVQLNKSVLEQVLRYNIKLRVPFLIITNGSFCRAFTFTDDEMVEIEDLPAM